MALIKLNTRSIPDAEIGTVNIADDAVTPVKIASELQPFNRIINGAMTIDQRNAGATLSLATTAAPLYAVDRFFAYQDKTGVTGTVGQSTDAPAGFKNSFGVTITTGSTSGAADQSFIAHLIEGLNVADLGFGTANAQTITLSFWVKSSITGTNGFSVGNSAGNRAYIGSYTVNLANTWEQKTVTIAGDTSGTWLTTNGIGIRIRFNIGSGSNWFGAAGSWGTFYNGPTGSFSTTATSGATFYITGLQLEVGSTASPFEHRQYGQELALCQRYYEKSYDINTVAGTNTFSGAIRFRTASSSVEVPLKFTQTKRATPTVTPYSIIGPSGNILNVSTGANAAASVASIGQSGCFVAKDTGGTDGDQYGFHYTASAEL